MRWSKNKVSKKVYFSIYFLALILTTLIVYAFSLPVHIINIFLLPFLIAVIMYKDRSYLILLVPSIILGLYLSYYFTPSFILSAITLFIIVFTMIVFSELIISYFEKTENYEAELKESKNQFELLLNYTYDWEYWIKPDGSLGYSSPSCLPQTGYSQEEFLKDKELLLKIVHPDDREKVSKHFKNLRSEKAEKLEFKILHKKGKTRVIRHTCQPVYDNEGNFIGRRATNRNSTDRWLAEQKLKESEREYRNIFNSLIDVYFRTKIDGTIELVSPSIERISGYKPSEIIGKNAEIFYKDKEDRQRFRELIFKEGIIENYDFEFVSVDGKTRLFSFSAKLIKSESGNPIAVEGIFRDVTELKQKEKALRNAQAEAQRYLEIANVMILVSDREANIELINKKGAEILEVDQEKIIGKNFIEVFEKPEETEESKIRYLKIMEGEIQLEGDYENTIIVNGKEKIIFWHSTLLKNEKGENTGLLSSGIDVTKERLLRKELEMERNKYRNLFENNIAGVFLSTIDGEILECNKYFAKLLGYEFPEEIKSRNAKELYLTPKERENFIKRIKKEKHVFSHELTVKKKNGEIAYILENASLIEDKYLQGAVIDITNRKLMEMKLTESEKELREMNESKDKFFSIIAHDIRSPFTALLGYTQLLMEEFNEAEKEELELYIKSLDRTAHNIFNFIESLLEWSRAQSGRIEVNPINTNLFSEVESVIQLNKGNAESKGVEIVNNINKELIVYSDENILNTVLRNLISNAIKFTNRGDKIFVAAQQSGESIVVSVQDTGVGIYEENLKRLFHIDTHYTSRGTNKETGSGLGLILCKELIEKQGGKIWVESKLGEGSKFNFILNPAKRTND